MAVGTSSNVAVTPAPVAAEPKQCDLCAGRRFEIISRRDRRGQELLTGACTRCGLVAHQHIPSEAELNAFYATRYRDEYHGETTPSARRVMRAWRNGLRIYGQLAPWLEPGNEVFEIGAGIGCTVKLFDLAGHPAAGIEPNHGFQQFSRDHLHAAVADAYLFDLPPRPAHDLVLLIHVIEHFRSPREALDSLHRIIRPSGRLYVECPNLAAPFTTRSKLFHFAHIHNFTPPTLEMLARRCGFEVEHWFSRPRDPNLQALLRSVDSGRLEIAADSYRQTIDALNRYNALTYHLRWSYLWPRLTKLRSYLHEHLAAERYLRWIEGQCAPPPQPAGRAAA